MRPVVPIALVVALAFPTSAAARPEDGYTYPGEHVTDSVMVQSAARSAVAWWQARDVTIPADITFMVADDLRMPGDSPRAWVMGRALVSGTEQVPERSTVWLRDVVVRNAEREQRRALARRRHVSGLAREYLWTVLTHELGHAANLRFPDGPDEDHHPDYHSADGLMSAALDGIASPYEARVWRRQFEAGSRKGL